MKYDFFLRFFFFKDGWGGLIREHELESLEVVRHGDTPGGIITDTERPMG